MTVVLGKKPAAKSVPISKAVRRTNLDPGKERRRALKRREKLIKQLGEWSNQSVLLNDMRGQTSQSCCECVSIACSVSRKR